MSQATPPDGPLAFTNGIPKEYRDDPLLQGDAPFFTLPNDLIESVVQEVVAVGTALSGRPPHRSVREELPHTAPTLGLVTISRCSG